jgi:hypothetical protein
MILQQSSVLLPTRAQYNKPSNSLNELDRTGKTDFTFFAFRWPSTSFLPLNERYRVDSDPLLPTVDF